MARVGGQDRTHHKGPGGWAALQKGTEGWRMTRWPGDGSPTSACVGCFEAWGKHRLEEEERSGWPSRGPGRVPCCQTTRTQYYSALIMVTLLHIHNNLIK